MDDYNSFFLLVDEERVEAGHLEIIQCWGDGEQVVSSAEEVIIILANRGSDCVYSLYDKPLFDDPKIV